MEKQIAIIFAGTQGYLDDVPLDQCRKFEDELYRFVDNAHKGLWEEIRTKKTLDDDLRAKLKGVVEEFKARFVADQPAAASQGPAHA